MKKSSKNFFSDPAGNAVGKFERMLKQKASIYFDIEEVEEITDHYLDRFNERLATRAIEHGLGLFPNNTALLMKKAQVLVMKQEPGKALKILDYLTAIEPSNTDLLLFKAVVHRNAGDHEASKDCLLAALETTTENHEEIYLDLAYEQEMARDYEGAIASLKQSLRINPDFEPTLFEIGFCYEMNNDVEGAVDFFGNYLDEHPYNHIAWYNLALSFDKLGLQEKALEAVEYALAITEDFTGGHIFRAQLFLVLKEEAKAIEAFREGLIHDPENPQLYTALGECYESLRQYEEAEHNYRRALHYDTEFIDAIMGLGAIREAAGQLRKAAHFYREAFNKDIFNVDNQHIYAETLVKLGDFEEAELQYRDLLSQDNHDEDAWIGVIEVYEGRGQNDQALRTAEEALTLLVSTTDLKWHYIKLLLRTGHAAHAETLFHDAATADPEGIKYFVSIFRDVLHFPNIAALIEYYTQAQSTNEL